MKYYIFVTLFLITTIASGTWYEDIKNKFRESDAAKLQDWTAELEGEDDDEARDARKRYDEGKE